MLTALLMLTAQAGCDITVIEGRIETPTATHEAIAIAGGRVRVIGSRTDMPEVDVITLEQPFAAYRSPRESLP